ncbi:MAG: hypothetical protein J0M12_14560 [Deltaproteobacteria bacterium]|nr:hypothetical protein [Deltaproteobacteria bacterium]
MKKVSLLLCALLGLAGCNDSNPSPPSLAGIFLDNNSTSAGSVVTTSVTFWVTANSVDGVFESDPQTIIMNLPVGTTVVAGSSNIGYQGERDPDAAVTCPDGTQSLVYNLKYGEVDDPYNFSDFVAVINVNVTVETAANQQLVQAAASLTEVPDPCSVPFTENAKYFVSN